MKQETTPSFAYSTATAHLIPQKVIDLYVKWRDCNNAYRNYHWIKYCEACDEINKSPLKVQSLIIDNV